MNISSFSQAEDEEEEEQQDYPGNDEAVQQDAEENNQGINIFLKKNFFLFGKKVQFRRQNQPEQKLLAGNLFHLLTNAERNGRMEKASLMMSTSENVLSREIRTGTLG